MIAAVTEAVSARMEERFSSWSSDHAKKTGKEVGKIRHLMKQLGSEGGATPPEAAGGDAGGRDARYATPEDLNAAMRIGELRAQIPERLRDRVASALEGKPLTAQAEMIELLMLTLPDSGDPTGATPPPRTDRRVTPPVRSAAAQPKSLREYMQLTKTEAGRKRKAELDADPSFHLDELPYSTGR